MTGYQLALALEGSLLHIFNVAVYHQRGTPRNNPVEGARKIRIHPSELLPKNHVGKSKSKLREKMYKHTTINL